MVGSGVLADALSHAARRLRPPPEGALHGPIAQARRHRRAGHRRPPGTLARRRPVRFHPVRFDPVRSNTPGTNTPGTNTPGTNTPGTNTPGTNQPTTPNAPSTSSRTLAQLQRQALRLTLIARLPAADRQQAGQLLDRADALRQRARDVRRQELQAYVDALQAGAAPADARTQAQQKVAGERSSLTQDEATLRTDAQTFVQKVPQARAMLRDLSTARGARTQTLGRGFGSAQGWGQGRGMGQDMNRQDMNRRGMGQGMGRDMGHGMDRGRSGPGWDRYGAPYGPYRGPRGPGMGQGMGQGTYGQGMNGQGMGRGWMDRGWMDPDRNAPWQRPGTGPRNGPPQNGTPPTTPPNTPQNSTPPAGTGTGGA